MHPSSVLKYFLNNKKRFVIVTLAIMLGVFLLYSLSTVIESMETAYNRSILEPITHFSVLSAGGSFLTADTIDNVSKMDSVERVIPLVEYGISLKLNIGGYINTSMYIVKPDDIGYLIGMMGLKLTAGRLPYIGSHETVLNKDVAQNLGVEIGDNIGSGMNNNARFPEQYTVVGLLEGKSLVSFAGLLINDAQKYNIMIIPKEGRHDEMDEILQGFQSTEMNVETYNQQAELVGATMTSINLLITAICITVVIIISACIGFLCYIYYIQRQNEYGLLRAIGYTRQQVINRAFSEIGLMNLAGLLSGIGLSLVAGLIMKIAFYQAFGQVLYVFNLDALAKAACVPIFSTFFSLAPIWRLMKKSDPVHVMDS